jgi:predicted PurR-regulated permease PerM
MILAILTFLGIKNAEQYEARVFVGLIALVLLGLLVIAGAIFGGIGQCNLNNLEENANKHEANANRIEQNRELIKTNLNKDLEQIDKERENHNANLQNINANLANIRNSFNNRNVSPDELANAAERHRKRVLP